MSRTPSTTRKNRLINLIDEHIDHLNYIQDIYILNNQSLSQCLSEQLFRRLFVPVYLSSLLLSKNNGGGEHILISNTRKPLVQPMCAIFLCAHFFSTITFTPLLNDFCELFFYINDEKTLEDLYFQKVISFSLFFFRKIVGNSTNRLTCSNKTLLFAISQDTGGA